MSARSQSSPSPDAQPALSLARYVLGLGDDALVYGHRLGEWMAWSPMIEEDMALANVSLDLLGQARALLTYAGSTDGSGRTEDQLAFFRTERDFLNVHLVEQPRGDFGHEMARMLWFSAYQRELYARLAAGSSDETLRGVATKALKEVRYHHDHASMWTLRLGDGTDESHERMQAGVDWIGPYVDELFDDDPTAVAAAAAGVGVLPSTVRVPVTERVEAVLAEATLRPPAPPTWRSRGGRDGLHSEAMGYLLAEMQHIARSDPAATAW
ncbi:MAG: 1,2-phenylacetyl-CoA epoxidase subunit PaaC [Dermatophilaceae bacterium]